MKNIMQALLMALALSGCAADPVQPWQREYLARPEMSFESGYLSGAMRTHTFVSKEAASGGPALAGGGCGCN